MNYISLGLKILPYLISAILLVVVYFYSYNQGYTKASLECSQRALNLELQSKNTMIDRLQSQIENNLLTAEMLSQFEQTNANTANQLFDQIQSLSDQPTVCTLPSEIVEQIKTLRSIDPTQLNRAAEND